MFNVVCTVVRFMHDEMPGGLHIISTHAGQRSVSALTHSGFEALLLAPSSHTKDAWMWPSTYQPHH